MRQTTITQGFKLGRTLPSKALVALLETLNVEDDDGLSFFGVLPSGSTLKCVSELLVRCAPMASVTLDAKGLVFVACDTVSGRLVHIVLRAGDMLQFECRVPAVTRYVLECAAFYSVCRPGVGRWVGRRLTPVSSN